MFIQTSLELCSAAGRTDGQHEPAGFEVCHIALVEDIELIGRSPGVARLNRDMTGTPLENTPLLLKSSPIISGFK